ncbi:MAG: Cro/C1-type DNA-binding domain [Bacteroidetes bacterium]|jgi:DNA-binding Xre family transcriptional regulator|nr:Cro/C1-type DNA-binding domain [Bacteroidota bacterium]
MLIFNVNQIFKARGIDRPLVFLVNIGFTSTMAHNILNNKTNSIRLSAIENICRHLNCTPNDILTWVPEKNRPIRENHPLTALKFREENFNLQEIVKTMPLEELRQFMDAFNNLKGNKEGDKEG